MVVFFQAKEQQATMEEKFRNELNANIKLSNLYKVWTHAKANNVMYCFCHQNTKTQLTLLNP